MFDLISRIHSIVEISPYRVTWFQADSSCFQICFHLSCFTFQLIIQSFIQWFDSIVYILCSPSSIQWFFVVKKKCEFHSHPYTSWYVIILLSFVWFYSVLFFLFDLFPIFNSWFNPLGFSMLQGRTPKNDYILWMAFLFYSLFLFMDLIHFSIPLLSRLCLPIFLFFSFFLQ